MTYLSKRMKNASTILFIVTGFTLSACATKSDRDRPPRGGDRAEKPARSSGTFLHPAAFLFADMDSNKDKVTSREEMETGIETEWAVFGRNPSATIFANWSRRNLGSTDAKPTFMNFDRDFNGDRSEMIIAFEASRGRTQKGSERPERGQRGQGGRGGRPQR